MSKAQTGQVFVKEQLETKEMDERYSAFFDLTIFLGTNTYINIICKLHIITIRLPIICMTTCSMNMNENPTC